MSPLFVIGDISENDPDYSLESYSNLATGEEPDNDASIIALVLLVFTVASFLVLGIVCYWSHCHYGNNLEDEGEGEEKRYDSTETQTEFSTRDLDENLEIREWYPSHSAKICKGKPIQYDDAQLASPADNSQATSPPRILALFPDSRGFGNFEWSDESSTCDDDNEDHGLEPTVNLVDAGVFKRTLVILKKQPRCVLCSVAFKMGDKISVSSSSSLCGHQFHQGCIRNWMQTRCSTCCPVCQEDYALRPNP